MRNIQIVFTILVFLFLFGCGGYPTASATPMKIDCSKTPSNKPSSQLSYEGIYAGITSEKEVKQFLGSPLNTSLGDTYKILTYSNAYIFIDNKTNIVHDVFLYSEIPSMSWFIDHYGCPDVVTHYELHPETSESSNYVSFAYFKAGIVLRNYRSSQFGIPVLEIGASPTNVLYTEPFGSLEEYLSFNGYDPSSNVVKIIDLEEAIK
jgi:hypothetical protein